MWNFVFIKGEVKVCHWSECFCIFSVMKVLLSPVFSFHVLWDYLSGPLKPAFQLTLVKNASSFSLLSFIGLIHGYFCETGPFYHRFFHSCVYTFFHCNTCHSFLEPLTWFILLSSLNLSIFQKHKKILELGFFLVKKNLFKFSFQVNTISTIFLMKQSYAVTICGGSI